MRIVKGIIGYFVCLLFCLIQLRNTFIEKNNFLLNFIGNNLSSLYVISTLIVLVAFFIHLFKHKRLGIVTSCLILFNLYVLLVSFFNGYVTGVRSYARNICFIMLFDLLISYKFFDALKYMSLAMNTLLIINVLNILSLNNNLNLISWPYYGFDTYFLGLDNGFIMYVMPALLLGYYCYIIEGKSLVYIIPPLIGVVSLFDVWCATSIVCFFILMALLCCSIVLRRYFNSWIVILSSLVTYYFVVVINIYQFFADLILSILHKTTSVGARINIWNMAISRFKERPLFGYGYSIERNKIWYGVGGAHNEILDMLTQGGIIGCIFYFIVILLCIKQIDKHKEQNDKLAIFFIAIFISLGVVMNFESYSTYTGYSLYFVMLLMAGKYKELMQIKEEYFKEKKKHGKIRYKLHM